MLNITFFTTNRTKLAHARYLAENLPIKINGFRERTYHAAYEEPRLPLREELLHESYRSAVIQAKKARILTKQHFFILEDTSVKIDALSADGTEVPGLDVKYWMRDATFDALDEQIKLAGGNRRATVRSDVLLHIPEAFKDRWRTEDDYAIFTGVQTGHIVEHEVGFETNVVYPWLDNQTFNKWFQPDGASGPLGSLPINEAVKYDFRKRSFDELFSFLDTKKLISQSQTQEILSFPDQRDFILCGYTCAGKTTASQYLARSYGYLHIEASDFMHLSYYLRHGVVEDNRIPIGDFAERALAEKPEIAAEGIASYFPSERSAPVVISGFRSLKEVEWLQKRLGARFRVVFIDGSEEVRFSRMSQRNRIGDVNQQSRFRERDAQQKRMGLDDIRNAPNTSTWSNEATIQEFKSQIQSVVGGAPTPEASIARQLSQLKLVRRVVLEDAILIALLTKWNDDENREFFTTSEIAKIANDILSNSSRKHKDNVSRYFNQNYYVYYEIKFMPEKGFRTYRLSNTGYGKALWTLRDLLEKHSAYEVARSAKTKS
ncbi:non-canonical purine NTP pyrophosphatase [Rhizobium sp.]|uniref:non-canonical purine NTP pyrophosphatase n=1 Tax=Rhizobium sp. TaxID=391 RepID=UPI0028A763B7